MNIIVDYRERESGIIDLLKERNIDTEVKKVSHGDYIINNWITVERKTAKDFLVSIISRRLFYQLTNLKEHCDCPILLIEGNPYKTDFNFKHNAIKGALLSIQTIWYIPIIFSCSKDDTSVVSCVKYRIRHSSFPRSLCLRRQVVGIQYFWLLQASGFPLPRE